MKGQSTRAAILKEGIRTLSREGLPGVTIGRLADASGLSKSGMFAHFRSRQALEVALLDEAAGLARQHVVEPAMGAPEGLERLKALLDRWFGWSRRAGLPGGCPVASALFELDDAPGELRDHVAALDRAWRDLLADLVKQAIALGHLRADADVDQLVFELCGLYLAHHVYTRFYRDAGADKRAAAARETVLERFGARAPSATTQGRR